MSLSAMDHLVGLTALRDRDQLDLALTQVLTELYAARMVGIYRIARDKQGQERWLRGAELLQGQSIQADPHWADMDELPLLEDFPLRQDALNDQLFMQVPVPAGGPGAWLTVMPMMRDTFHSGVVELHTDQPLSIAQVQALGSFLNVVHNHQCLLDTSQRDPLTGLLNRQTFDATFLGASLPATVVPEEVSERRKLVGDTWWMGVVDIDHFKTVNDRFGHLIGDEVLVLVARLMRQTFRQYDRLFRFGGEEFVVMVRCPLESGALMAFERLRNTMQTYAFPQVGQVTVSVGVTEVRAVDAPSAAFSRADEAVYQAKHQGRNRVLSHTDLLAKGVLESASHEGDVELF